MISKDSFVKIMDSLRDYWDELGKDMDRLGVVFESNHLTRVFDNIMDALCDDLEADLERDEYDTPWCYYFAFELDWGRAERAKNSVRIDDVVYPLCNAAQLYDLLTVLNEREKEKADEYSNQSKVHGLE